MWWWPEQSLKVAAVWRCVNIVCNALSSIPWRVMRIEEDGRMQDKMHPLHQLPRDFSERGNDPGFFPRDDD